MDTLIAVADLGGCKVYRFSLDDLDGTTSIKLVVDVKNQSGHSRQGDRVTDQAGRFSKGGSGAAGGMSFGENHNEKSESRRRSLETLAASLEGVLKKENNYDFWYLAAPKTINQQLLDLMEAGLRKRVKKNLALDLMKLGKKELMERFGLS